MSRQTARLASASNASSFRKAAYRGDLAACRGLVKTIAVVVGATIGGALGWWLGALVGPVTAFIVSAIGTGVGVYAVRRLNAVYLP